MFKMFSLVVALGLIAGCSIPIDTGLGAPKPDPAPKLSADAIERLEDGSRAFESGNSVEGLRLFDEQAASANRKERLELARTMSSLGVSQSMERNTAEAIELHTRALEIREEAYGDVHPEIAESLNFLGAGYYDLQRYEEAEAAFKRALEIRKATLGPRHRLTGRSMNNLAFFYAGRQRFADAEPLFVESIDIIVKADGAMAAEIVRAYDNYAAMLADAGREDEAEELTQRSAKYRGKRSQIQDIIQMTR